MKQRFDGLDVMAMVAHLQRTILGRRVVNIYDGQADNNNSSNADTYILKLDGDPKVFLCLQSGIRFNDFDNFNADGTMPSPFCAKLRKHLKGLRLEQIKQIGADRVVLFSFLGGTAGKHHIILELYAKGNLIMTNQDYQIMALLRSHVYQENNNNNNTNSKQNQPLANEEKDNDTNDPTTATSTTEKVAVKAGSIYPVTYAADVSAQLNSQTAGVKHDNDNIDAPKGGGILSDDPASWAAEALTVPSKKAPTLKTLLLRPASGVFQYGPALLEHCILFAQLPPHTPLKDLTLTKEQWQNLQTALREEAPSVLQRLAQAATTATPGYLIYQELEKSKEDEEDENNAAAKTAIPTTKYPDKILQEFQPHILLQHVNRPRLETKDFGQAVHDFFGQLQAQKAVMRAQQTTKTVQSKLEKARQDQQERLQALEEEQLKLFQQAEAVEQQAETVDQALAIINSALNSGMDWDQLEEVVQVEKENQNPIALLIQSLNLADDVMTLGLPVDPFHPHVDDDSDGEKIVKVEISLKETAHANASRLFAKYRGSKDKAQKTAEAADKALQAAEETAKRQMAEAQKKTQQTPTTFTKRKPFWFEKFHWFITSDNYLVVGGKDAHQNETLVKRYLRPGDAYLHADVHGASSCILRAKRRRTKSGKTVPIPLSDQALREAGNFTICHSSAWASRMITSAWWVESHQVSKTAPTGEYLTVGSFMVRGKKNFLPPSQLEMGLAVLFRLGDEDSIARHQNERRDFALMALQDGESEDEEENDDYSADNENNNRPRASQNPQTRAQKDQDENDSDDGDESENDATENGDAKKTEGGKNKKGLSARDRKLIKRYGSLEEAERVLAARPAEDDNESVSQSMSQSTNTQQQTNKRGKKAKLKRAKKKYADQDEEDKELAMLLLQGSTKKEKRKGKNKENVGEASETQQQVAAATTAVLDKDVSVLVGDLDEEVRGVLGDCVEVEGPDGTVSHKWQSVDFDIIEQLLALQPQAAQLSAVKRLRSLTTRKSVDNLSLSLAGIIRTIRKHGYENLEKKIDEDEGTTNGVDNGKKKSESFVDQKDSPEQNDLDIDEDVGDDTAELSKLTGKPTAEDSLLFAMPVFAPYQTLSQYSLRVKLTPGNMKRGKAAKQAIDMLGAACGSDANGKRLKELMKFVSDNDWIQALISDVKISVPGASKVTKQQKAKSKKNKKGK